MQIEALFPEDTYWNLLIRFIFNLGVLYVLVGLIYYRFSKKAEYLFSYFLMGIMIFLICSILGSIDLNIGMALGLFAIFAIIRYRTITYTVRDITYLFIIIGISIVNSQANIPPPIFGAVVTNLSVILITYLLEIFLQKKSISNITVVYNKLELLKPGLKKELLEDLSLQTGKNIEKVTITKINISNGNAEIEVFYKNNPVE
jgi:hypothetical protein